MDVNNILLYGNLTKTVYMMQPPSSKDMSKPDHICILRKAIYMGFKQAPGAWYAALEIDFLLIGFHNSKANSSLFIYRKDSITCYFLLYVDECMITGSNSNFFIFIIKQLGDRFSLSQSYGPSPLFPHS